MENREPGTWGQNSGSGVENLPCGYTDGGPGEFKGLMRVGLYRTYSKEAHQDG